jgi:type IV secretory pathway VirB2 component (pilin)
MDPIGALLTAIDQSFRSSVLVPMAILSVVVVGAMWMLGNQRNAQERAVATAVGLAVILGATRIVTWIQGAVH